MLHLMIGDTRNRDRIGGHLMIVARAYMEKKSQYAFSRLKEIIRMLMRYWCMRMMSLDRLLKIMVVALN